MSDDPERRRAERAERAASQNDAKRRRGEQEAARAQVLVDRFVSRAQEAGLATEELTARPWSGGGRYRTGVVGWYLRRDRSIGIGVDGGYYVLLVPPKRLGRWRGVSVPPTPPPLQVGQGGRDGDAADLGHLLQLRLGWGDPSPH